MRSANVGTAFAEPDIMNLIGRAQPERDGVLLEFRKLFLLRVLRADGSGERGDGDERENEM